MVERFRSTAATHPNGSARTHRTIGLRLLLLVLLVACGGPTGTVSGSPSTAPGSCQTSSARIGGYLYGGALGVQEGISVRIRPNQPPLKIMWANRAATPPRQMMVSAQLFGASTPDMSFTAGWAATPTQPTFPSGSPVTGYVSEIPPLPSGGCWTFRWTGGAEGDAVVVRVPDQ